MRLLMPLLVAMGVFHLACGQDCPVSDNVCSCILADEDYGDLINCSSRALVKVPTFNATGDTWETLLLSQNNLGVLGESSFTGLNVRRIIVDDSKITSIEEGAFDGLADVLVELDLRNNALTENTILAIRDLPLLTDLILDYNEITTLDETHFINLPSLAHLSMQFNEFMALYPEYVANVPTLLEYDIYGNRITFIHNDSFSSLTQLLYLNLGINLLGTVPTYSFRDLTVLELLSLWANDFTEISEDALSTVPETLDTLWLGYNDVYSLPEGLLTRFPNLRVLFLESMLLDSLPDDIFASQSTMIQLALSDNSFDYIPTRALENLPGLLSFYEKGNLLTSINGDEFLSNPALSLVDFSENAITFVNQSFFCHNPELYWVDLDSNNIELFESCAAITNSGQFPTSIHLSDNPLFCGCDILWLHEREIIANPDITICANPEVLAGRALTEITPEEFQCDLDIDEVCAGVCSG